MKNPLVTLAAAILAAALGAGAPAHSSQDSANTTQDANLTGLHDFDSLVGLWKTHHRRLKERLADSHEWVEFGGTFDFRLLMRGFVNVDDSVYEAPSGAYLGVGLSAYDSKTGDWAIWGLDGRNPFGTLDPPNKGHFEHGVGTFYADDTLRGKPIRTCYIWSRITTTSPHFEQAFSSDGGKTWETNWITEFERVPTQASQDTPNPTKDGNLTGSHDFDFLVGQWKTHHRQLNVRQADSHEWVEFDGTYDFHLLMNGWANMGDNVFKKPDGDVRGVSLRSYDPKTGQWAVWWLDGRNPSANLDPPTKGRFENGTGTFYSDEILRGKPIRVRVIWSHTSTSARWEQAFSPDGGKTWETNWITEFRRIS